jgi:hypothetical protein
MGLVSWIRKKPIPDPGSRIRVQGQKGTGYGSATLLLSTWKVRTGAGPVLRKLIKRNKCRQ